MGKPKTVEEIARIEIRSSSLQRDRFIHPQDPSLSRYDMTPQEFGLFFISILTNAVGQYLLKSGALKLGTVNARDAVGYIWSIVTTPELLSGLCCYGVGALAYILLLTKVNLSVAGPAIALVYVISVLLGFFVFNETIPPVRLVGLGFIICGVILVIWQK